MSATGGYGVSDAGELGSAMRTDSAGRPENLVNGRYYTCRDAEIPFGPIHDLGGSRMNLLKLGQCDLEITPLGIGAWAIGGGKWQFV